MHDPKTVAHEIYLGRKQKKNWHYRSPFITIWHNDPETDGIDDSCGWFMRERHIDKNLLEKVVKEFEAEWDNVHVGENGHKYSCGWFTPLGSNVHSVQGIVLNMYIYAAKIMLNPKDNISASKMWKKAFDFVTKHHVEIMYFAENNRDSISDTITRKFQIGCRVEYTPEKRAEMIRECAVMVATDIARRNRKWYKHPKWHVHHWSIQFHPFQNLKRRYWDKCCKCGKRGYKGLAFSDWGGSRMWHQECDDSAKQPQTNN